MSSTEAGSTGNTQADTGGVAETVSVQATKVKEKGRLELREQLDQRTNEVGRTARGLADALRRAGSERGSSVGGDGSSASEMGVERVTSGVADRLDDAGSYLEQVRGEEMLRDAERFVRTRPWLVAGAAAAVGFAISRLVRASSERRYDQGPASSTAQGSQQWRASDRREEHEAIASRSPETTAVAS